MVRGKESSFCITIKPSDKRGNIIVLDNDQYIAMCNKILQNQHWYCQNNSTFIDRFHNEFYQIVDAAYLKGVITMDQWEFIRTTFPHTRLYALPKLHKDFNHSPRRPIISGNGSLTKNLSTKVDEYLRLYVVSLPTYIQDTIHLLQIPNGLHISPLAHLVAIDI